LEVKCINKIRVFSHDDATMCIRESHNRIIISFISGRQIEGVIYIMPILLKQTSKTPWKLGIDQEDHPVTATIRLICANLAA